MNSKEFILWLKGFTEGVHEFNITPKQWDNLKEKLAEVDDNTIPMGGVIVDHNTFKTVYPNWTGINPYETKGPETPTGTKITTTPGTGYITIANPNLVSWATGSSTTNTAQWPITGANVSYTTYQPFTTQTNDDFEKKILNEIKSKGLYTEKQSKFKKRKAKSVKEWEDTHDLGGQE
jgi:hypothetical protein